MTDYAFSLANARLYAERLEQFPADAKPRRWVLRDDNQRHYHGRIPMDEDPVYVELRWKHDTGSQDQLVGRYRLHLAALVRAGHARLEGEAANATEVRLRFYRADRGVMVIQARLDEPALPIGTIDATLY